MLYIHKSHKVLPPKRSLGLNRNMFDQQTTRKSQDAARGLWGHALTSNRLHSCFNHVSIMFQSCFNHVKPPNPGFHMGFIIFICFGCPSGCRLHHCSISWRHLGGSGAEVLQGRLAVPLTAIAMDGIDRQRQAACGECHGWKPWKNSTVDP